MGILLFQYCLNLVKKGEWEWSQCHAQKQPEGGINDLPNNLLGACGKYHNFREYVQLNFTHLSVEFI